MNSIGFMQGRLSPIIDGKIQAFPWNFWKDEMFTAVENKLNLMEWTLDHKDLMKNPIITKKGQDFVNDFIKNNDFQIYSLTGDCFMQAPLWKLDECNYKNLYAEFKTVVRACNYIGIKIIVIPCVDFASFENIDHEDRFNIC